MIIRRILTVLSALLLSGVTYGQTSYDILLRSKALTNTGKPEKVIYLLSSAPGIHSDSRLLAARAEAKLLEGDYTGAAADFNTANKLLPGSGEYGLSRLYAMKGDVATSLYHLEISMRSAFNRSEKEILLDPAFGRIENTPGWRQFWKKEWYSVRERKVSEIEYYVRSGKIIEAMAIMPELERDYPDNDDVVYAGALINAGSGKYGEAVKSLSGILAKEPDNTRYLKALASVQNSMANFAGASDSYTKLIGMETVDPELFMLRAECFRKTGEREKAMADITRYLTYYPESKAALSLAGKTESSSGNNLKALEYFSENLRFHPNDPECYLDRGNSYFISKSWQWAINDFSMSLDLDPGNSEAWLSKGIALLNSGKNEDACHDFRQAFALGNKKAVEYISRYCIK
jgi:tetratricopeptide (TPR) repeat protein